MKRAIVEVDINQIIPSDANLKETILSKICESI